MGFGKHYPLLEFLEYIQSSNSGSERDHIVAGLDPIGRLARSFCATKKYACEKAELLHRRRPKNHPRKSASDFAHFDCRADILGERTVLFRVIKIVGHNLI